MTANKQHWENVYETKGDLEVSWYQDVPNESLELVAELKLEKEAAIIDVGGGNSNFTAELLKKGYSNLSILDISQKALNRTKEKIGSTANVDFIATDILDFKPKTLFDLWHDRAAFHFLTEEKQIQQYADLVSNSIVSGGFFILSTFSTSGPLKCSGLEISQYSKEKLEYLFKNTFEMVKSFETVHATPFDTEQNFIYAVFRKR
jgi:cyclopropane fatty-acyl-phospholipid synthase-like methyltransferase